MTKYTVRQATATGKKDAKFGDEYLVDFNEDTRTVTMSRKTPVVVGQEENGTIVDGSYGAYFKKDPYQPTANGGAVNTAEKKWAPIRKDNSDGMRQGMCMNNAANFVNSLSTDKTLTAVQWATLVFSYAQALYRKGDLKPAESPENAPEEVPTTVAAVFGDGAVSANG